MHKLEKKLPNELSFAFFCWIFVITQDNIIKS
jgi:hypothetical protein